MITCHSELDELIDREKINLVIQAADVPSTTEVARMINYSCDKKDIAFIVNPGYFGNSVSLPEFYYPNNKYDYISSHLAIKGKLLLHHESGKLSYRLCSTLGSLVAEQVEDYRCHCCPAHYGEKGYFDIYIYMIMLGILSKFVKNQCRLIFCRIPVLVGYGEIIR